MSADVARLERIGCTVLREESIFVSGKFRRERREIHAYSPTFVRCDGSNPRLFPVLGPIARDKTRRISPLRMGLPREGTEFRSLSETRDESYSARDARHSSEARHSRLSERRCGQYTSADGYGIRNTNPVTVTPCSAMPQALISGRTSWWGLHEPGRYVPSTYCFSQHGSAPIL